MVEVLLPDGFRITAELACSQFAKERGLSPFTSLPENCGMLFVYDKMGYYPFWMAGCQMPLDIIWLDAQRRVVEFALQCPPAAAENKEAPLYGGNLRSMYVLEIGAGVARKHGVELGKVVGF